jgi:hypothetical protein
MKLMLSARKVLACLLLAAGVLFDFELLADLGRFSAWARIAAAVVLLVIVRTFALSVLAARDRRSKSQVEEAGLIA